VQPELHRFWVRRPSAVRRVNLSRPAGRRQIPFHPEVEALELRQTPTVTFTPQQTFAAGASEGMVAADFNGDGRPDLAVTNVNTGTVSVLLNTTPAGSTTPSYATQQTFTVVGLPLSLAVGDFNGDGRPDLVVTNSNGKTVSVLLNTTPAGAATPTFAPQQTFAVGTQAIGVVVADFNGDGRPDLAVTNSVDNTVSVLLNTTPAGAGTPTFAPQQTFAVGNSPFGVTAADFNGDGRPDLVVTNNGLSGTPGTVSVLLNTTPPGSSTVSFAPQQTFAVGNFPQTVAAADVNGDGRPDLAVANFDDGTVSVLLNTTAAGAGTPTFAPQQTFAVGSHPFGVATADLDGDGRPDLAVANNEDRTVSVLLTTTAAGATTPAFAPQQTFAVGTGPGGVAAADFNGDGRPDLAVANVNFGAGTVSVLLNTTAPFGSAASVVVADFGSTGVFEFNRATNTWTQLGTGTASSLAADPLGDVAGAFGSAGVWLFKPSTGFKQIGTGDASLLAMDALGDVAGAFGSAGVWLFRPAIGFRQIGTGMASTLAMDAQGDVVGTFPGHGVWLFRPAVGFQQLGASDASVLTMDALGDVIGTFPKAGIWEFRLATGFQQINTVDATALAADPYGNVVASFAGVGVGRYQPTVGWQMILPAVAAVLGVDALGDVFGAFTGFGVWEADAFRFPVQLRAADASVLVVA
jgi:hypothetical protein